MDSRFWESNWQNTGPTLSRQQQIENNLKWLDYWNHVSNRDINGFTEKFPQITVKMLLDEGVITPGGSVLEVGCGNGAYTLELAKYSGVDALDMSPKMLGQLEKKAAEKGLGSIMPICSMWEDFISDKKYGLVFSAMCPAVRDVESLLKMEQMSGGYCCIISVSRGSKSQVRSGLRRLLDKNLVTGPSYDLIYPFNYLYSAGRYPNIRFRKLNGKTVMTTEQAIERYIVYFGIFGLDSPSHRQIIRQYITENSVSGHITDNITYNMATMWWKAGKEGAD